MNEKIDYSKYECPYSHLEKECGHELHSPVGYQDVYSVWCECGFRAPVFYLDPVVLGLKLKDNSNDRKWVCQKCGELVDGRNVTFEEYHEGCGGRCI
jgi:hypothetical protein